MQGMDLVEYVLVALRRIIRATDLYSKKTLVEHGLTVPQLLVLRAIRRERKPTVGTIAKAVNLSQGTVTSILGRLEVRGLALRTRSDRDRRCVLVETTDEGARVVDAAPPLLHESFVSKFRQLKDWEQTTILSSLQRIAEMMAVEELSAAPVLSSGLIDAPTLPDAFHLDEEALQEIRELQTPP